MRPHGASCDTVAGPLAPSCDGVLAPYFAPLARWLAATAPRAGGSLDLSVLNDLAAQHRLRTESGRTIRFVEPLSAPRGAYERVVHDTGCVPTRTQGAGMLHDWFNALAWLAFPRAKARLNAVHVAAGPAQDGRRGRARDAATLFDESGAVFVCREPRLRGAFVARDWQKLFVRERSAFGRDVRIVVFGHALFEKLLDPYKSICAHAIVLDDADATGAGVDATLAARLDAVALAAGMLHPLPLLGVPGWCPANEDPAWYDDPVVFRRERRPGRAASERNR